MLLCERQRGTVNRLHFYEGHRYFYSRPFPLKAVKCVINLYINNVLYKLSVPYNEH